MYLILLVATREGDSATDKSMGVLTPMTNLGNNRHNRQEGRCFQVTHGQEFYCAGSPTEVVLRICGVGLNMRTLMPWSSHTVKRK